MANTSGGERGRSSPIRAVIFDFGEVLCHPPDPEIMGRMARVFQIDPNRFLEVYSQSRGPYDQGLETPEEYWLRFAKDAGVRIDAERIEELRKWDTRMWSRINYEMKDWLVALHEGGFTTALLSNMQLDMAEHARRSFPWLAHFDHLIFSYEVRLIKPDAAIFHHCLSQIGARPEDTLFVDDRELNVEAAKAVGINAVRFQSVEQLRRDLEKVGFEVLPSQRK